MKRKILPTLCLSLALTSCKEELLTSPKPIVDECEELVLSMSTATLTKGLIKDTQLPNGSSVGITIKDTYEDRAERMSKELCRQFRNLNVTGPYTPAVSKVADQHIRMLRISLPKDRNLKARKESIKSIVSAFEKEKKYDSHITINVDPV